MTVLQNTQADMQRSTLELLLAMLVTGAWCAIIFANDRGSIYLLLLIIFVCVISYLLRIQHFRLSYSILVFGVWCLNAIANVYQLAPISLYLFSVIVFFSTYFFPFPLAFLLSIGSSYWILADNPEWMAFFLLWINFILSYVFLRAWHTMLASILDYQAYAVAQMQEARERRAELASTAKALFDARERLANNNIQLSQARDTAETARRLKAQFAANVSHELRTPINLIVGFSEVIAMAPEAYGVLLPSAYRPDIMAIYRNAKHLQNLINDILDISQLESERLAIIKEEVDTAQVIADAAAMAREMIASKGVEFIVDIAPNLPKLWLDPTRIRQVILNLLANAIRFTDTGQITLKADVGERELIVSVSDTGIGIPAEQIDKIFDEFYQVEGTLSRKRGGTGLGLALSRQFVKQHGGRMWAESSGIPQEGSRFSFSIDLGSQTKTNYHGALPLATIEKKPSLLLLDKDFAIIQLFKGYCKETLVLGARDLAEMETILAENGPNAILLAENLDDATFAAVPKHLPIIRCPMPSGRRAMQAQGIADYLVKPVSRAGLLEALGNLANPVKRVLVVDDEHDIVRLFTRMLQSVPQAYEIYHAYNGHDGLAILREQEPDAIILDILMPDIDGFTVIEAMKADAKLKDIPIIVASARGASEAISPSIRGQISLSKVDGFQAIELVNCVEALVSQLISVSIDE